MMNDWDDDNDEDERKPAARPSDSARNVGSPSTESLVSRQLGLNSTTIDNDFRDIDKTDDENLVQSVIGEIPFLITHWLNGYSQNGCSIPYIGDDDPSPASLLSTEARKAALKQIQKATSNLAVAFQALGAFGTTKKVRSAVTTMLSI
jgi:hypothetical protein